MIFIKHVKRDGFNFLTVNNIQQWIIWITFCVSLLSFSKKTRQWRECVYVCIFCFPTRECQISVPVSLGGPCELPLTGDLWDWEQKQPRNQGFSEIITLHMNRNAVKVHSWFICVTFDSICFLFPAIRWWEQWQQQRVCCLSVRPARYAHPALQTSVSLQLLRRHSALPGQQLSDLQAA